ncbi:hypothetical protein ACYPKM_02945 [Pseudomonas aeruginosa]
MTTPAAKPNKSAAVRIAEYSEKAEKSRSMEVRLKTLRETISESLEREKAAARAQHGVDDVEGLRDLWKKTNDAEQAKANSYIQIVDLRLKLMDETQAKLDALNISSN